MEEGRGSCPHPPGDGLAGVAVVPSPIDGARGRLWLRARRGGHRHRLVRFRRQPPGGPEGPKVEFLGDMKIKTPPLGLKVKHSTQVKPQIAPDTKASLRFEIRPSRINIYSSVIFIMCFLQLSVNTCRIKSNSNERLRSLEYQRHSALVFFLSRKCMRPKGLAPLVILSCPPSRFIEVSPPGVTTTSDLLPKTRRSLVDGSWGSGLKGSRRRSLAGGVVAGCQLDVNWETTVFTPAHFPKLLVVCSSCWSARVGGGEATG